MRTHYGPWQPCWISNQHQKHKSGRGPSSEHFWQVWLISVQRFQRRRFKCEKLTDGRTTDAYPWQKLTWPMARWAKKGTFAEKVEQRAVIKFCVDIGKTPTDTHKFLKQSEKHSKVSRSLIFKWHKRFADGRDSLADDEQEGRPSFRESDAVKNEVRDVINGDRRLTVCEVADKCGISKTTAHQILGNYLNMNRVCARWLPRILTAEHLTKRVELSKQFIKKVNRGGIRFLDRIITTDESWFHYYDPETKQQSSQWKNCNSPRIIWSSQPRYWYYNTGTQYW